MVHQIETVFCFFILSFTDIFILDVCLRRLNCKFIYLFIFFLVAFVSAIILRNVTEITTKTRELHWSQKCTCLINEIAKESGKYFFWKFKMTFYKLTKGF